MIITPLAIGLLIGAVLGLTGAGGSLLAVPVLLLLLPLTPAQATGLALGVVAVSSSYGAVQRIRHREVLWIPAILFGASGVLLAPLGRWLATQCSPAVLVASFSLLSLIIATRMAWQSLRHPEDSSVVRADASGDAANEALLCRFSETTRFDWRLRCTLGLVLGGGATGLLSGFFGVGGGFLIVPFLNLLNGVSMRHAVATSLVIIAGISLSGFVSHLLLHPMDWPLLAWLGAGGVAGMSGVGRVAHRLAGARLQQAFALTIVVMTIIVWIKSTGNLP